VGHAHRSLKIQNNVAFIKNQFHRRMGFAHRSFGKYYYIEKTKTFLLTFDHINIQNISLDGHGPSYKIAQNYDA